LDILEAKIAQEFEDRLNENNVEQASAMLDIWHKFQTIKAIKLL
jgi:hypothetical protein